MITPVLDQGEDTPDIGDIMAALGRNTAQDKRNKRKYQKEVILSFRWKVILPTCIMVIWYDIPIFI